MILGGLSFTYMSKHGQNQKKNNYCFRISVTSGTTLQHDSKICSRVGYKNHPNIPVGLRVSLTNKTQDFTAVIQKV